MNDLTIQRGNPRTFSIAVTDSAGNPYDLTGKTVFFTLKHLGDESDVDTSALILKTITSHTNPTAGLTGMTLSASDTLQVPGRYKCDIRIYSSEGVQMNTDRFYANIENIVTKRII